jgi:hypothetical protein
VKLLKRCLKEKLLCNALKNGIEDKPFQIFFRILTGFHNKKEMLTNSSQASFQHKFIPKFNCKTKNSSTNQPLSNFPIYQSIDYDETWFCINRNHQFSARGSIKDIESSWLNQSRFIRFQLDCEIIKSLAWNWFIAESNCSFRIKASNRHFRFAGAVEPVMPVEW